MATKRAARKRVAPPTKPAAPPARHGTPRSPARETPVPHGEGSHTPPAGLTLEDCERIARAADLERDGTPR